MSDTANRSRSDLAAEVIIAGAGPCGLVLALELGRRGIETLVINDRASTSPHPQANATQARTMEHFRRLGVAERVRAAGLPEDYRPDIAYFTRFLDYELTRMSQPPAAETAALARASEAIASVAELPHRASQMYVERILREQVETLPSVKLRFNSEVTGFDDHPDHVSVRVRSGPDAEEPYTARYLVGCDGARSRVRGQLGIRYGGTRDTDRPFLAGAMYSIHFRSEEVYELIPHPTAWQYWAVNPERRGLMIALDGHSTFVLATQLREGEDAATLTDDDAREIIHRAMGRPFALDIVSRSPWTAGLTLVADRFGSGNVLLGGDAAHLFTPTGGLGYNTAVEDAVNLGWKLAAVLRGWGGDRLLASYELERKPVAERNTSFARTLAQSVGGFEVPAEIEDASGAGAAARTAIGDHLAAHARSEFNIPGITLGARYDDTELIVADGCRPPDQVPGHYEPTACPGGRAPHAWLADGSSLFDTFGPEFTLLKLGGPAGGEAAIVAAARRQEIPLTVRDLSQADLRDLYEADLALVRPDQIVCWRGSSEALDADAMLQRITGW